MTNKKSWVFMSLASLFLISGCATGRNYQTDIDALNARVSTLQGQLTAKDEEVGRLQNQLTEQQAALAQAESEKRMLSEKMDKSMAEIEARSKRTGRHSHHEESDLK